MSNDLNKLYSGVIKVHNDAPFHFEKRDDVKITIKAYNPICGDRFNLFIEFDQNKIIQLHFHGYGCAISKASTSILTKLLEGKTRADALKVCDNFLRFINKELEVNELILFDDFRAFSGVHDFPERYDCATLSWKEMKKFLESATTQEK